MPTLDLITERDELNQVLPLRARVSELVRRTQEEVCAALEQVDGGTFQDYPWSQPSSGGGLSRVLQDSRVFEKAGVNVSDVFGHWSSDLGQSALGLGDGASLPELPFFATGVSLILHPHNPMAPTVHANYRYFELGEAAQPHAWWFGGSVDLTPAYLFDDDARHFHGVLRKVCDRHDRSFYPRFKRWCDEYFCIVHRKERRGIGGIFFDRLNEGNPEALYAFVADAAQAFLSAYLPILERRKDQPFTAAQKEWQAVRRGRYVEFNLLYDRGTQFGLKTIGLNERMLMSLPLTARWRYEYQPEPGTEEARLLDVCRVPRDWA
jgi:coproporphyrinogen III oxidase